MKKKQMKKAAIENIFVWIVLFVGFATFFFFIIDYATILRVKDNMQALSDYGANYVAINGVGDNISTSLNDIKANSINSISADTNSICNEVTNSPLDYQVVFTTQTTNNSYKFYGKKLSATTAVFNQQSGNTITCTLNITLN